MTLRARLPRLISAPASSVAWALCAQLAQALGQGGAVVAAAQFGSPEILGRFALATAVLSPLLLWSGMELRSVLAADIEGRFRLGDYVSVRAGGLAAALAVFGLAAALAGGPEGVAGVAFWVAAGKSSEAFSELCYGVLQRRERWDKIALSNAVRAVGSVAALAWTLKTAGSLPAALAAAAAWNLICLAGLDLPAVGFRPTGAFAVPPGVVAGGRALALAKRAFPLGVVAGLVSLNFSVPRYVIEFHLGVEALGYFAAIAYLPLVANTMFQPAGRAYLHRLAESWAGDKAAFRRILKRLFVYAALWGAAGAAASMLWGGRVLSLLYGDDYAVHQHVLTWMMAAMALVYLSSVTGYALTAMGVFRAQAPVYLASAAAGLAACAALVPGHGILGAAYASGIAWLLAAVLGAAVLVRASGPRIAPPARALREALAAPASPSRPGGIRL